MALDRSNSSNLEQLVLKGLRTYTLTHPLGSALPCQCVIEHLGSFDQRYGRQWSELLIFVLWCCEAMSDGRLLH